MTRSLLPYAVGMASGVAVTSAFAGVVMGGSVSMSLTPAALFGQAVFFAAVAALLAVISAADLMPTEATA